MSDFLQLVLVLAILISATKVAGLLSTRMGQPAVLGELLVGLLLGPSLLNVVHLPFFTSSHLDTTIHELAEFGVIFLMFIAGLEIEVDELRKSGKVASFAGVLGVLVPLGLGWGLGALFGYDTQHALFIGVLMTATSVSISAQTLMELGVLRSRVGVALLGAAVLDDVLVILVLSVFLAIVGGDGGAISIVWTFVRMVLFLGGTLLIGRRLIPWLAQRVARWPISQPVVTLAVVVALLFAWMAEVLGGVAAITGAFLVGVLFARTPQRGQIERGIQGLAYGFLVPIFFASIGLQTDARALDGSMVLFTVLACLVAVISKVVGCGLGARLGGFPARESLQLGVGMISRGEVGLIVASVGISAGLIGQDIFAMTVIIVLVTTLVTPLLLRAVFGRAASPSSKQPPRSEGADTPVPAAE
ncbi:cation:proton antiporter [Chloroflexia bacterium SDU3-3]|nr:cation:proton antiporter [Chloroflexia bacterium SDU3-3]